MSGFEDISCRRDGAVAYLTVSRADRLNACRDRTADELRAALADAEDDAGVACVVMTGQGRAFGAGYDLSTLDTGAVPDLDAVLEDHFNPLIRQMRASRLPIVAQVNGPCAGASVGLALAADIVVAARSAYFYEPFVGIALVPDAGNTAFLTHLLGRVRAAGMMLLGERITAAEAADWGLVWRVFEDADLAAETRRIAERLAAAPRAAIAATKRLIREAGDATLDRQLDLERDLQGALGRRPEMQAAIAGFFSSRRGKG